MNAKTEIKKNKQSIEAIKWIIVFTLLLIAIVSNYLYRDITLGLRVFAVVGLIIVAGIISLLTAKGRKAINFAREARTEIRKVIWSTRQETFHTTLIVVMVTTIMSLVLWGLDSILVFLISYITGLRF